MKKIYFLTTNNFKFAQFMSVVNSLGFNKYAFEQLNEETVEIQAENNEQVANYSSQWAANKFKLPIIKEDVSFYIAALDGFPGPYLSQIEKQIKSSGYLKLLQNCPNRQAHWQYSVSFCQPGQQPIAFSAIQHGTIAKQARGECGSFTDKIFVQKNESKTICELLDENMYQRHNEHYQKLLAYLQSR